MKKKVLSMILAIAMVISMFAGLATTASAAETITTGEYVIAAKVNGVYYAMSNTFASKIAGAEITVVNGTVTAADAEAYKVTVTALGNGNITISSGANYLKYNSSTNFATATEAYEWTPTAGTFGTWRFIAASTATASTVRSLVYRTGTTNKFAPYGTSNINGTEYYDVELLTIAAGDACTHANATSTVTTAATCTTAGEASWTCPDCPATWTTAIPATGHTWDDGVVTTAPTCTEAGVKTCTCSVCSDTKTETIPATGHNYVDGTCNDCGKPQPTNDTYEKVSDAATLAAGDVIILVASKTDATTSTTSYYAAGALGTNTYLSSSEVTPESDGAIRINTDMAVVPYTLGGDATNGWTLTSSEGPLSNSSAKLYADGTTGNATWTITIDENGAIVADSSVAATTDGYLTRILCNTGTTPPRFKTYNSKTTVSMLLPNIYKKTVATITDPVECQHTNATEVPAASATCTAAGNSAYWSCPDCGKYFSDAAFTTETTLEAVTIPATGHTPGAYTSNNNGTHTYTCSVCNEVVTENCSASVVEEVAATCNAYSQTEYECSVCGGTWTVTGTEFAAHTYVNGVCSVCSDALDKYVKVTDLSTLAVGDTVVIYYPASNMALTSTASGKKLAGVVGQIDTTGNGMMYVDGAAAMTVAVNEAGQYQFSIVDAGGNTLYLTSGATGNSLTFAAAPADGATDYTLWTIVADTADSTIAYIKSVNATYNSSVQALEYYNGFTTYGEKTTAAYQFNFYKPYVEGEHVHSYTSEVTTPATCLTEGLKTYTCACGDSYTEAIPATGHSYAADAVDGTACANGCGHTLIEAKKTVALEDGMTVIFYSANISKAMDSVANGAYLNAIAPNTAAGDTLLIDDGVALMTVEVVEGGYRFKLGDNYLSYRGGRNTLVFEPLTDAVVTDETAGTTTDYTVFSVENGNALYCVNGDYDYNGNVNKLYLEAYGDHYTSYNCSDNTAAAFVFTFYTTSEVCNHVADEGTATTPATCTTAGVMTYTCTTCGKVLYTAEIPATGHNYVDGVCTNCGEAEPNFEGDWYIAVARSTGNYFYMKNTMQNTAGTRFSAVDSGLTALPEAITEGAMAEYVFHIAKNADGNYVLCSNYAEGNGKYIGWNGNKTNTATLVAEADARAFTVVKNDDGTVKLELIKSADETTAEPNARYLSMNATAGNDYFAWYKEGQRSDLTLIPVSGEIHVHSYTTESARVDATCTTDGSVTYTCSCGKEKIDVIPATGHTIGAVEAVAPTCTTDGNDAYYKCSKCDAIFSDAEGTTALDAIPTVPATGHTEVIDEAVAPTCTTTGLTAGSHCSVCNEVIVAQTEVAALGHSYTYVDNGDGTHTVGCANCDYSAVEAHSFTDGTCVCGATETVEDPYLVPELKFFNVSLNIQSYIGIDYTLYVSGKNSVVKNYDSFYTVFNIGGEEQTLYVEDMNALTTTLHYYEITATASQMTENITATLYAVKDGVTYHGETVNYTIREGVMANIASYRAKATLTAKDIAGYTFAVDMLKYGANAQVRFNNLPDDLADSLLTEADLAYATTDVPALTETASYSGTAAPVTYQRLTLSLGSRIEIQGMIKYNGALNEDLELHVSYGGKDIVMPVTAYSKSYGLFNFNELPITDVRTEVSIVIYNKTTGTNASQVWTGSIAALAAELIAADPGNTDAINAMMRYGDSACAYFNAG